MTEVMSTLAGSRVHIIKAYGFVTFSDLLMSLADEIEDDDHVLAFNVKHNDEADRWGANVIIRADRIGE